MHNIVVFIPQLLFISSDVWKIALEWHPVYAEYVHLTD